MLHMTHIASFPILILAFKEWLATAGTVPHHLLIREQNLDRVTIAHQWLTQQLQPCNFHFLQASWVLACMQTAALPFEHGPESSYKA